MMKRPSIAPRRSRSSTLASSPSWRTASARGARFSRRSRSRAPRRSSASTAGSAPPARGDCVPRRGARPRVPSADCASTTADRRAGRRSSSFTATAPRSRTGRRRSFTCVRRAASWRSTCAATASHNRYASRDTGSTKLRRTSARWRMRSAWAASFSWATATAAPWSAAYADALARYVTRFKNTDYARMSRAALQASPQGAKSETSERVLGRARGRVARGVHRLLRGATKLRPRLCAAGLPRGSLRDPAGPARERGDQRPSPAAGPPLFDPPGRQSLLDDGRSACVRAPSRRVLDEGDPKAR